nr:hypothetical protein Iba_chr03cCG5820 [Ipomoea batatas]
MGPLHGSADTATAFRHCSSSLGRTRKTEGGAPLAVTPHRGEQGRRWLPLSELAVIVCLSSEQTVVGEGTEARGHEAAPPSSTRKREGRRWLPLSELAVVVCLSSEKTVVGEGTEARGHEAAPPSSTRKREKPPPHSTSSAVALSPCMSSTTRRGDHGWGVRRRGVHRQHHRSCSLPLSPSVAAAVITRCWLFCEREERQRRLTT